MQVIAVNNYYTIRKSITVTEFYTTVFLVIRFPVIQITLLREDINNDNIIYEQIPIVKTRLFCLNFPSKLKTTNTKLGQNYPWKKRSLH